MFTNLSRSSDAVTSGPAAPLARPLTRRGRRGRTILKRFLYTQLALRHAFMIAIGREQPLVNFTVEADPPSVYFVYRIKRELIDELRARLNLPAGFRSTPIRCLRDDEPAHLITLNVYSVRPHSSPLSTSPTATRPRWSRPRRSGRRTTTSSTGKTASVTAPSTTPE